MSASTPATTRYRWLRPLSVALVGVALLWLAVAAFVYSTGSSAGDVAVPTEDDFWGYDYLAYLNAAERLADTGSLYQAETLAGPYRPGPFGLYMYAPPLGVSLLPAVGLGFDLGMWLWFGAHLLALVAACVLMPVRSSIRLLSFVIAAFSFAVVKDMALGNVSVLLLLPLTVAWRWLDRPLGSIAQALAIAVRPTLGIVLIWQLLRRQWRAVAWTVAAGLAIMALTLPAVGVEGYLDYLTVLRNMSGVSGVLYNYDLSSVALELGTTETVATLALLAGYAIAIGAIVLSLRRDRELGFMVTIMASLLLSPLLWDHYLAMLVLPAAFLAQRGRSWAILLPLAAWLPVIDESWTFLYPVIVIAATLLPFTAREPEAEPEPGDAAMATGAGAPA